MTDYEPGTVADLGFGAVGATARGFRDRNGWLYAKGGAIHFAPDDKVTDVRLLVVLDLDAANPAAARTLVLNNLLSTLRESGSLACEGVADQIEAQTKPPRIPEPGKYGVVRASGQGLDNVEWVSDGKSWVSIDGGYTVGPRWAEWHDLKDPVLIREGVE